jgi:predicted RNase H-like HicB family nuclease
LPQQASKGYPPLVSLTLTIELDREADSRWIADIPALPGVLAYGSTPEEASARATALALRVLADEIEHGERSDADLSVSFVRAAA